MAKYKVGDKVRIVSKRPQKNWNPEMDKWLGKTMTIIESGINYKGVYYYMEADHDDPSRHWFWYEGMIAGLVESARKPYTVELRFDGMITTATLKRGGRDVKTAEARCNPKDTYSRAEGAKVAVERLFEKKRKEDKPKESKREQGKPKVGDKFVVVQKRYTPHHSFAIGDIVTLEAISAIGNLYCLGVKFQFVDDRDLKPYKEKSK
nr:MAG TPA: Mind bomb SH3 repeat domain [Caudoviricetes sp.]